MEDFLFELIAEILKAIVGSLFEGVFDGVGDVIARLFDWCRRGVMWLGGAVMPGIPIEDRLLRLGGNGMVVLIIYALFWR